MAPGTRDIRKTSEKAGLKTNVMTTGDIGEVTLDGNIGEMVTSIYITRNIDNKNRII